MLGTLERPYSDHIQVPSLRVEEVRQAGEEKEKKEKQLYYFNGVLVEQQGVYKEDDI